MSTDKHCAIVLITKNCSLHSGSTTAGSTTAAGKLEFGEKGFSVLYSAKHVSEQNNFLAFVQKLNKTTVSDEYAICFTEVKYVTSKRLLICDHFLFCDCLIFMSRISDFATSRAKQSQKFSSISNQISHKYSHICAQ